MIIFDKNKNKLKNIEGMGYQYDEFQHIMNDEMKEEAQKKIDNYDKDENIFYYNYLEDTLKHKPVSEYDHEIYNNYIENYIKFNNKEEKSLKKEYSGDQKELLKNIYIPELISMNENEYVDMKYLNKEYLKEESSILNININETLPGMMDKFNDKVINNIIEHNINNNDNKEIIIKDIDLCCDFSGLNIEHQSILFGKALSESNKEMSRPVDPDIEEDDINAYNYPYYKYMSNGDKLYNSLYLYYNKSRDIGSINL